MTTVKLFCTMTILLLAVSASGQAQESGEYERFNDPFRVYFGGFYPSMSSKITIEDTNNSLPPIRFEDTLGVEDGKFVPWGGAIWHISRRNTLEFEYFQLNRDRFIDLIPEPIEVGYLIIAYSRPSLPLIPRQACHAPVCIDATDELRMLALF